MHVYTEIVTNILEFSFPKKYPEYHAVYTSNKIKYYKANPDRSRDEF